MSTRKTIALAASLALACSVAVITAPVAEAKAKSAAPGKVSAVRVSNVTANGAVLSWRNPKSKKSAKFTGTVVRVAAGTHAPKSVKAGGAVATLNAKKHTVGVRRLTPGTVYTVSIFSAGTKKHYSKAATVRVQTAPAAVTGLYAQTTTSSLTLGWHSPSRSAAGAIVRYAVGSIPATPASGKPIAVRGRTPGATVGGLRFGTTYGVAVWAVDAAHHISPRTAAAFKTSPPTTGGISGVVTESGTNKPLRNADVRLVDSNDDNERASTATNGSFAFADVKPGAYSLWIDGSDVDNGSSEAGYVGFYIGTLTIKAGDPLRIAAVLQQAAGIRGKIVGSDDPNAGIAYADIYARSTDDYYDADDSSDEDGSFSLTDIDSATADGICAGLDDVDVDGPDTDTGYVQRCLDLSELGVTLQPGKISDLPHPIELQQAGAIAGSVNVTGDDGETFIIVFDSSGTEVGYGYAEFDELTYKAGALEPGVPLYVCARIADESEYNSQCYDGHNGVTWNGDEGDLPDFDQLKPVTVQAGHTVKPIDFTLAHK